jgi:predicted O-methyltransferase YrrM
MQCCSAALTYRRAKRGECVSAPTDVPAVVRRALALSGEQGYLRSSRVETGWLLSTLAASRSGTLAELGTGCGVGTAWLATGKHDDARVVTVEIEPALAEKVRDIFTDEPDVEVIAGDWTTLATYAPFSLLFVDVRDAKESPDAVADLIETGGMVVLDDFTPCTTWPPIYEGRVDVLREMWLTDKRFTAVDVMVAPDASVIVATRR